ncbi:MAG: SDR family oxidoreductase [Candidatus Shapirobacteria bacterium]|nr:SDR family oxidoreductase [Candidatus Shapirobacteria bacterium]
MFKDKVVLVTGGSSGIGMATAILFAEKGADVAITYKSNKKGAENVVDQIKSMGRKSIKIKADLSKDEDAKKAVKSVIKEFKKLDIVINNAGRYIDGDEWNLKSETWIKSIKQNLISVISVSKYATEFFEKQGSGIIVNVASKHGISGHTDSISYGAAKAGVINVTHQSYSKLLSSFGGRANSVSPGAVNTGYWLTAPREELEARLARNPNHKLLETEDVVKKIVFLCSDEARGINGQNFPIE